MRSSVVAVLTLVMAPVAAIGTGCAGENPTSPASQEHRQHDSGGDMSGMDMSVPEPPDSADWNAADASYLAMMIGHHRQALDMSELAATQASDPRVTSLARTIRSGQGREIVVMATWLVDHGLPEPTLDEVEMMASMAGSAGGMPGMLSPTQMTGLEAASGADFDRLFLEGMIQHHQGAVGMAESVLGDGEDVRVSEMAAEVIASQNGEIRRMRAILADLP